MTVRTFGRKTSGGDDMARRVEAFLAEERARKAQAGTRPSFDEGPRGPGGPVFVPEKSVAIAYLLWFLLGAVSAHRFYLGFPTSALIQLSLWLVGWMLLIGLFLVGLLLLAVSGIWILADAFIIPSLARTANDRARRRAVSCTFA